MNARKAVLADNPELILRVLQLRFDESLSYPRISAQTICRYTASQKYTFVRAWN